MNKQERELRDALVSPLQEATRVAKAKLEQQLESEGEAVTVKVTRRQHRRRAGKPDRGIFEKVLGSGIWWVRYVDAQGRYHREKAGTWGNADKLLNRRRNDATLGKKLPELRRRTVTFAELADDAITYIEQRYSPPKMMSHAWNS